MNRTLDPRLARYLVLAPVVLLSVLLSNLGYPPLLRVSLGVGVGAVLILLVARYQRRRLQG